MKERRVFLLGAALLAVLACCGCDSLLHNPDEIPVYSDMSMSEARDQYLESDAGVKPHVGYTWNKYKGAQPDKVLDYYDKQLSGRAGWTKHQAHGNGYELTWWANDNVVVLSPPEERGANDLTRPKCWGVKDINKKGSLVDIVVQGNGFSAMLTYMDKPTTGP